MGDIPADIDPAANPICGTTPNVTLAEHMSTVQCNASGRYVVMRQPRPVYWDLEEFETSPQIIP